MGMHERGAEMGEVSRQSTAHEGSPRERPRSSHLFSAGNP